MYQRTTTIINKTGIHARPASLFVQAAKGYQSDLTITNLSLAAADNSANAKSIIKVLTLSLTKGSEVMLSANGPDEQLAVDSLIQLIESGFGEN